MNLNNKQPIIGQEAVCPDGLGRVVAFKNDLPERWIQVATYVKDRSCKWDPCNVTLLKVKLQDEVFIPVAKVRTSPSGQIYLEGIDGGIFDLSLHQDVLLYERGKL